MESFENDFSVNHILTSIKKLERQLRALESKQPYQIVTPRPVNPINEESKSEKIMDPQIAQIKSTHNRYSKADLSPCQI